MQRFKRAAVSMVAAFAVLGIWAGVAPAAGSWSPPQALNATAAGDGAFVDFAPEIATDGAGHWTVVWEGAGLAGTDYDIYCSRSADNGATWTPPATVNHNAGYDSADDHRPVVETDGKGVWICAWWSETGLGGADYELYYSRSTNNGQTWSAYEPLNTDAYTNNAEWDAVPILTTDGNGTWVATWFSGTTTSDGDVYYTRSVDNGQTWSPRQHLNSLGQSDSLTAHDRWARTATDCAGNWVAIWGSENTLGGTLPGPGQRLFCARSADNGATWSEAAVLSPVLQNTNHPLFGPLYEIVTDKAGKWLVVADCDQTMEGNDGTDFDIVVFESNDNGATWSGPRFVNDRAQSDSAPDGYATLEYDGRMWVASWFSGRLADETAGADADVYYSTSTDGGQTWSAMRPVNANAEDDSGSDSYVRMATDRNNHWVAAWNSTDSLGGAIGTDYDILVARGVAAPVVAPAAIDFGTAKVGEGIIGPKTLEVTNTGMGMLGFAGSGMSIGGPDAADFALTPPELSPMAPCTSRSAQVSFLPVTPGPKSAVASVETDAPGLELLQVPLSAMVTIDPADVAVSKTASCIETTVGQEFFYTIDVSNNGPGVATGVMVSDLLPAEVELAGVTTTQGDVTVSSASLVVSVGTLPVAGTARVTVTVRAIAPGITRNNAQASALQPDPAQQNNEAAVQVTIHEAPPPHGPDLTGKWDGIAVTLKSIKGPRNSRLKATVKGWIRVTNIGDMHAPVSWVGFYLSNDAAFDPAQDTLLSRKSVGVLAAGESRDRLLSAQTSSSMAGKYVIGWVDDGNTVAESNETNNVIVYGPLP